MIKPILPAFIAALGGGSLAIGTIGGLSESLSSLLKVVSGYWSDRIRRRKPFVFIGYLTSATAKLFFSLSLIWQHMLVLMPAERIGKGVRGAPRDALIAASVARSSRGRGFGFHRTMDTTGAILGSLLTLLLIGGLALKIKTVLLIAALVAFGALIPLIPLRETAPAETEGNRLRLKLRGFPRPLNRFLIVATIFGLGNFTYMFLILRAGQLFSTGESMAMPILLYVLINASYAILALPAGILSDRIGRKSIILLGYLLFAITCLGLAAARGWPVMVLLFCLYGAFRALTDGPQRALVADLAPAGARGTALGAFHTAVGLAALPASLAAGFLWKVDPRWTFLYGAALGLVAMALLGLLCRPVQASSEES
jgi:MFS family permease